jgi:hypothetical protein
LNPNFDALAWPKAATEVIVYLGGISKSVS